MATLNTDVTTPNPKGLGFTGYFCKTMKTLCTKKRFIFPALLGILIILAYSQALSITFLGDDFAFVSLTQSLQNVDSVVQLFNISPPSSVVEFYRPIGFLLWFIMYKVWGFNPAGYHFFNLLVHWTNALLVAIFAFNLASSNSWTTKYNTTRLLLIGSILFALLPLHIETVVWVACQFDLLATAFYLATLNLLLLSIQKQKMWFYGASLLTYQLCLWSKETSFTLPLIAAATLLFFSKRKPLIQITYVLPYVLLLGINLLQRFLAWGSVGGYKAVPLSSNAFTYKFINVLLYFLSPFKQQHVSDVFIQIWLAIALLILIKLLMTGQHQHFIFFALIWIAVTLIPASPYIKYSVPLHYLPGGRLYYLPSVGFCLGIAAMIEAALTHCSTKYDKWIVTASVFTISIAFLVVIHIQIQPWMNAGQATIHIMDEVYPFLSNLPQKSETSIVGIPEEYQGAYIYINCFAPAYIIRRLQTNANFVYNTAIYQEEWLQSLPYNNRIYELQMQLGFSPETTRWNVVQARGVSTATLQLDVPNDAPQWNFRDCTDEHGWVVRRAQAQCNSDNGLRLVPENADPQLLSPHIVTNEYDGWVEVIVTMKLLAPHGDGEKLIQLFWANDTAPWWAEERSWVINLPQDTTSRNYHFFIPPSDTPVNLLRLDPINAPSDVVIERIRMRPVG
jgi:protein O-mannosyl-transferase